MKTTCQLKYGVKIHLKNFMAKNYDFTFFLSKLRMTSKLYKTLQ